VREGHVKNPSHSLTFSQVGFEATLLFLRFLYGGVLPPPDTAISQLEEVFYLAEKYDMSELSLHIQSRVISNSSQQNK
jgi:hypothetical protein